MSNSLISIPLCQLKRSKSNVRKTDPLAEIEQMAASIESQGLLENLVVRPMGNGSQADAGDYEVIAGSRRLAALKLLAKRKKLGRHHPVPCLLLGSAQAADLIEVSLAENLIRAPVHPADQFDAFARLQREGLSGDDIAARFGLSPSVVRQRLKLGAVSPKLMAHYREGAMTLEQLMAFTISDDRSAQEEVWSQVQDSDPSPSTIRRLLTRSLVEGADRRARYIGAKDYEEAGGVVVRNLFDGEDEGYFNDSQLLDRLVAAKLESEASAVKAEGWAWIDVRLESDYTDLAQYGRARPVDVPLSDDDEARSVTLSERYDELVAIIEDEDNGGASEELDRVSAELDSLQAKQETWPETEKSRAGVVISLDYEGKPQIVRGLIKPEDRQIVVEAGDRQEDDSVEAEKSPSGYSEALLVDLSAHRTAALQEALAAQPETALVALLYTLTGRIFFQEYTEGCVSIVPRTADLARLSQTVGESKAAAALLARNAGWRARLPEREGLWSWIAQLENDDRMDLLAYCAAVTIDAVFRRHADSNRRAEANLLATALRLDMADWWRPTQAGFLDRITKEQILQAVTEGKSSDEARRLANLKKSDMTSRAEALLAPTRWLPEPLRFPPTDDTGRVEPSPASASA